MVAWIRHHGNTNVISKKKKSSEAEIIDQIDQNLQELKKGFIQPIIKTTVYCITKVHLIIILKSHSNPVLIKRSQLSFSSDYAAFSH